MRIPLILALLLTAIGASAQSQPAVSPSSLHFVTALNAGDPDPQALNITTSGNWTAQVSTQSGGTWLAIATDSTFTNFTLGVQASGNATLGITVFTRGLAAGTYQGTVAVQIGSNPTIFVPVTLDIAATLVGFNALQNAVHPIPQNLAVSTATSTSAWTASVTTSNGGNWLSVAPTSGKGPGSITVTADATGLAIGRYIGYVTITGATPAITPVVLVVAAAQPSGPPVSMTKIAGDQQLGVVGGTLGSPIAVMLWDGPNGTGDFANATPVTFTITAGGGKFANGTSTTVVTTNAGIAYTNLTLPTTPAILTIVASAPTASGTISQTFNVAATVGPATALDVVASPTSPVLPGATLFVSVVAHDALGNFVNGYKATFTITAGGGTLSNTVSTTAVNGVASTSWMIGTGVNTLTVSGAGVTTRTFTVTAVPLQPAPVVTPSMLSFTEVEGGTAPASQNITVNTASVPGATFTVTPAADKWLSVSAVAGMSPASIVVSVGAGLTAGVYSSSIVVSNSFGSVTIPVALTVAAASPAKLAVSPMQVLLTAPVPSTLKQSRVVHVANAGGGSLTFTTSIATSDGGLWVAASPASGTAPQDVTLTADFTGQFAGARTALVTFAGSDGTSRVVQVNMQAVPNALIVDRPALSFTGAGTATVSVTSANGAPAVSYALHPAVSWATVNASASGTPVALTVSVSPPTQAGVYQAVLDVFTPGASPPNTVEIPLTLTVSATAAKVGVFASTEGTTASFSSGPVIRTGDFVAVTPADSSAVAFQIATSPGLTYTYDPATRMPSVKVDTTQAVNGGCLILGGMQNGDTTIYPYQYCAIGNALIPSATPVLIASAPLFNFTATQGIAMTVRAYLVDSNGNAITGAQINMSPNNGEDVLTLKEVGGGLYSASWLPVNVGPVSLAFNAVGVSTPSVIVPGTVATSATPLTFIPRGSAVNAASFAAGAPLVPGSLATVFGANLAASAAQSGTIPLPTTLAGVTLTLNGIAAPLIYAGPGQVNFEVPFELAGQTSVAMELTTGASVVGLSDVAVSAASPGIFLASATQGAIVHSTGVLTDATHPAVAGETVLLYGTGLGPVKNPPATGAVAGVPFSNMIANPVVTVGGISADVSFAGLAPGYAGLYQVNVTVPFGLPSGANPVVVQTGQAVSNTATIFMK